MRKVNQRRVIEYINTNDMLQTAFRYYLEYNTGCNNPYHNVNHTMAMMDLLIDMSNYMNVNEDTLNVLLLAAIFHDMNHSGGKMKDNYNVENAINAYNAFAEKYLSEADFNLINNKVVDLISATEFPYDEDANLTKMQRMIRECDNLVCFYDDFLTQVLLGLREEMHTTDLTELVENELKFFDYSWNLLKLPFSKKLVNMYQDEIKDYLSEFSKIIA